MKREKLTPKKILFCQLYAATRDCCYSAAKAGYKVFPEKAGLKLLKDPAVENRIKQEIKNTEALTGTKELAAAGLKRLAFSNISDPLKLLFCEEMTEKEIENLDLFMISEIKRPKTGGVEIKFYDRIKALERLSDISDGTGTNEALSLYNALSDSAAALKADGGDEQ